MAAEQQTSSKLNLTLIWAVVAFVGGSLFSAGLGWGHSTGSIDALSLAVAQLSAKMDTMTTQFNVANVESRERLKGLEDEVKVLQDQVIEARNERTYAPHK